MNMRDTGSIRAVEVNIPSAIMDRMSENEELHGQCYCWAKAHFWWKRLVKFLVVPRGSLLKVCIFAVLFCFTN
jgi:hypothetical protein